MIRLKLFEISEKKVFLSRLGGLYANKIHHFFLEIVSSMQMVSIPLDSNFESLFDIKPCLI